MNRLLIILILLSGFGVASDVYIDTAEAGKRQTLKDAIGSLITPKPNSLTGHLQLHVLGKHIKKEAREIKNKEVCRNESNQFAKVIQQTNLIYKKSDVTSEILGRYMTGEIICIRAKLGNFGLTAFGWIEDKNYTPLTK